MAHEGLRDRTDKSGAVRIAKRAIGKPRAWGEPAPPRYGRADIANLPQILDDAGFARPERIDAARPEDKGAGVCLGPDDGASYWQPRPAGGHVTLVLHHGSMPSNMFAARTRWCS